MLNTRALLKKLSTVIKVYINKNESDGIFETLLVSQSVRRKMKIEDREQKNAVFLTGKIIRKTCRGCLLIFGFQISLIQFLELSSRKIWVTDTRQFFFFFLRHEIRISCLIRQKINKKSFGENPEMGVLTSGRPFDTFI